jgi:galactokinase
MILEELGAIVAAEFQKHYGRSARWIVVAPGHVNVIGEYTDYNDSIVLAMGNLLAQVRTGGELGSQAEMREVVCKFSVVGCYESASRFAG